MREDRSKNSSFSVPKPANENMTQTERENAAFVQEKERKLSDLAFTISKAKLKLLLRKLWKAHVPPEERGDVSDEITMKSGQSETKISPLPQSPPTLRRSEKQSQQLQDRITRFKSDNKNKFVQRQNMTASEKFKEKFTAIYREYAETFDFIKTSLTALLFALLIRSFLVQPFNIPSESMSPTLLVGDYIFVNKFSYGYSRYSFPFAPNVFSGRFFYDQPERGDAAVFRVPLDGQKDYIKRIIGLPGDTVQVKSGELFLNGKKVTRRTAGKFDGPSADPQSFGAPLYRETIRNGAGGTSEYFTMDTDQNGVADDTKVFIVPKDYFFVMGDNRDNSQDSRFVYGPVGFVHKDHLIGKAFTIFLSLEDCGLWQFWKLPSCVRGSRFFQSLN